MKTRSSIFASLAASLLLPLASPVQAEHAGGAPYQRGILCLDGANRGSGVRIQLRKHVDAGVIGHHLYTFPWRDYYQPTVCKRLSDIGIAVGQVVDVHHEPRNAGRGLRACNGTGRYTIKNDGGNKHVFAQVGGRTMFDSNCRIRTDWALPNHSHGLLQYANPEDANQKLGNKDYAVSTGKAVIKAGRFCVDGANRGADLRGLLREFRGTKKGTLLHESPRLGYYTATHCVKMNDIGIPVGKKMVAWWSLGAFGAGKTGVCNGRNVIEHDGSDKVVWVQLRGSTIWNPYCETKRDLSHGPLK